MEDFSGYETNEAEEYEKGCLSAYDEDDE